VKTPNDTEIAEIPGLYGSARKIIKMAFYFLGEIFSFVFPFISVFSVIFGV